MLGGVLPGMVAGLMLLGPSIASGGAPVLTAQGALGACLLLGGAAAGVAAQLYYMRCPSCAGSLWSLVRRLPASCPSCGRPLA